MLTKLTKEDCSKNYGISLWWRELGLVVSKFFRKGIFFQNRHVFRLDHCCFVVGQCCLGDLCGCCASCSENLRRQLRARLDVNTIFSIGFDSIEFNILCQCIYTAGLRATETLYSLCAKTMQVTALHRFSMQSVVQASRSVSFSHGARAHGLLRSWHGKGATENSDAVGRDIDSVVTENSQSLNFNL